MGTVRNDRGVGALKGLLLGRRGAVAELETRGRARPRPCTPMSTAGVEGAAVHVAVAGMAASAASDLHVVIVVVVALGVICAKIGGIRTSSAAAWG